MRAGSGGQSLLPLPERPQTRRYAGLPWVPSLPDPVVTPQRTVLPLDAFLAVNPNLSVGGLRRLSLSVGGILGGFDLAVDDFALSEVA